jgi:hypothetical protein
MVTECFLSAHPMVQHPYLTLAEGKVIWLVELMAIQA